MAKKPDKKSSEKKNPDKKPGAKNAAVEQADSAPFSYCEMKPSAPPAIANGVAGLRLESIIMLANKWANGTVLQYYFFTDAKKDGQSVVLPDGKKEWRTWVADDSQRKIVRDAFTKWKGLGIGLAFAETTDRSEAEIRIGFMQGDGSWSFVGTDILKQKRDARTMNFGWDLRQQADTALHEIGHTLGLPHEHQNPNAGIVWNEEVVYAELAAAPNKWPRDKTFHNIIRKIQPDTVQGSSWDPDSIMHYPFKAKLIKAPPPYETKGISPPGGLSPRDVSWIKTYYPDGADQLRKLLAGQSQALNVADGQQADFEFSPAATRKYKIQTFGTCDTLITLFEEVGGVWRYVGADDDSGEDRNAFLETQLRQGRRYAIRVRLKFSAGSDSPSVMVW